MTDNNLNYYTLYSPSVFSLAESLQLILGNSATYRLFTNLYLQISEYSVGCIAMHDFQERCQAHRQRSKNMACRKNTVFGAIVHLSLFALRQCIIKQC